MHLNRRLLGLALLLAALFVGGIRSSRAAPGRLDSSFGSDGRVLTKIGERSGARALAIQSDGKIVTAGDASVDGRREFALARYRRNGSLDPSFGRGGQVVTRVGNRAVALALALQPNGRIIVAGDSDNGQRVDFALARYDGDGSLDASFGAGGVVTTALGNSYAAVAAVAVQADGKIVAAGSTEWDFALARYDPNGALDASFGAGGAVTISLGGPRDRANALALQPDGKIVVGGRTGAYEAGDFALARFEPDGSLDPGFGSGGTVTTAVQHLDEIHALALQPDGRILAAGESGSPPGSPRLFALARYKRDGSLDTSFGIGSPQGTVTTRIGTDAVAYSVVLQRNGKIDLAGITRNGGKGAFALARYDQAGYPDTSFGRSGGTVATRLSSGDDVAYGLALQKSKLIAAGAANENGSSSFALARYLASYTCRVPDVRKLPVGRAERAIARAHCAVGRVTRRFSTRVPKGRVISQRPSPGARRPEHGRVQLVVSKGLHA